MTDLHTFFTNLPKLPVKCSSIDSKLHDLFERPSRAISHTGIQLNLISTALFSDHHVREKKD